MKDRDGGKRITLNRKARHDYVLHERMEAGLVLQGWEAKSLRAGKVQIRDSYILLRKGEAYWFGGLIHPLPTASQHVPPDPQRDRKLLLHKRELGRLRDAVQRKGLTVLPTAMYWKRGRSKLEIAIARGKKQHDKRAAMRDRDWERQKQQLLKKYR